MNFFVKLDKDSEPKSGGSAPGRREKVEKFVVHIDENNIAPEKDEAPVYKGEVYFSNHPVKKAVKQSVAKGTTAVKRSGKFSGSDTVVLTAFILVILTISFLLSLLAISCLNDALAINRGDEIVTVNIPEGASTNEIIDILDDSGLIKNKAFCKIFYKVSSAAKGTGVTSDMNKLEQIGHRIKVLFVGPDEPDYISGVYYLQPSMGLEGMLCEFREVQAGPRTVTLVFPEGWSIPQIAARLEEYGVCDSSYFFKALNESAFDYQVLSSAVESDNRTYRLEGYLFPSTYDFFEGESANIAIRRMLDAFDDVWIDEYDKRAKALGYSVDEIITIASIIQREAADESQMGLVSSVIHNRLKNPSVSNGRLECDSTKDYIKNYITPITDVNLVNKYTDAYNTYLSQGLPPGPICNPGEAAIKAALYPSDTNYYYFCHDKFGNIYMAKTKSEHDSNVLKAFSQN